MNIVTKILAVFTLVFSIATVVLVFMTVGKGQYYRETVEREQLARLATQATLELEKTREASLTRNLEEARKSATDRERELAGKLDAANKTIVELTATKDAGSTTITDLNNQNQKLTAANDSLAKQLAGANEELKGSRPEMTKLTQQNAELNRKVGDLTNQVALAEKTIRNLQEQLAANQKVPAAPAAAGTEGGTVASLSAGTPTAVQVNGRIEKLQTLNGKTFVELTLGTRDGVQVGNRFTIYRGSQYVGDAVVRRTTVDHAVAEVTLVKQGQTVQATDLVISGGL